MLIATDFLWVGLSSPKTFTFHRMPLTLSFCAEPNGEVAESIIQHNPLPRGERGPSKTMVEARQKHFFLPLIRPDGHILLRKKVFLR